MGMESIVALIMRQSLQPGVALTVWETRATAAVNVLIF